MGPLQGAGDSALVPVLVSLFLSKDDVVRDCGFFLKMTNIWVFEVGAIVGQRKSAKSCRISGSSTTSAGLNPVT